MIDDDTYFLDDIIDFSEFDLIESSSNILENFDYNNNLSDCSRSDSNNSISENSINLHRSKRKLSQIIDESKDINCNNCKLYNKIDDVESKIMKFPSKLFNAINKGDFYTVDNLINTIIDKNCSLKWSRNAFSSQMVGSNTLSNFFRTLLDAMPDAVVLLRDMKCIKSNNENDVTLVKCKLRMSGTMANIKCWEDFYGFKMPSLDVLDYMDLTKLTIKEADRLRKMAASFRQNQLLLQVFGKMKLNLYINNKTYKVILYEDLFSISSFTPIFK